MCTSKAATAPSGDSRLLLHTKAPVTMPHGINFSFLSLTSCRLDGIFWRLQAASGYNSSCCGGYQHSRSFHSLSILWGRRSVQHPVHSADSPPPVHNTHLVIKASPSATASDSPPDPALRQDCGHCEAIPPVTAPDSAPDPASPGRHKVGPDSTWAVRQSAELEDLQAALDKQYFRRGRQAGGPPSGGPPAGPPAAAVHTAAAAEEDLSPPQDVQDAPGPKYGEPGCDSSADNAVLCFAVCIACQHAVAAACTKHAAVWH